MVDDDAAFTDSATDACERTLGLVAGRAEAVASAVVGTSALTRFANNRIHQNVREDKLGVRLTVAVDGKVARAVTTRTDPDGLAALVERALAIDTLLKLADRILTRNGPRSPLLTT
ncbi:MAG: PmbA/TldA family metallopeptidase [Acidimicrobiales bacterium]